MARREVQFFNLSFLDVLSGALGAVIFMFIITPKGGKPAAQSQQISMSFDTVHKQVWGLMADSLLEKKTGDTLFAIVVDYKKLPTIESCPPCPKCPPQIKENQIIKSNPYVKETPVAVAENALPQEIKSSKFKGDPPSVPCKVSFEVKWKDLDDNVDFFVCKGSNCVYGARKRDQTIGFWDSGKSKNRIFGDDLRTTMEAVRQFEKIIPGEYKLFAQFKSSLKSKTQIGITGLIYSINEVGDEKSEQFAHTVNLDIKGRTLIGSVQLQADGQFNFIKN